VRPSLTRRLIGTIAGALVLSASALQAADPTAELAAALTAATARGLESTVIDFATAEVTDDGTDVARRCAADAVYVDRLKGQLLIQVVAAYASDVAVALIQHQPAPLSPPPFPDKQGKTRLTGMLDAPDALARLGEALATYPALLAGYRTIALAGIEDVLRFEALEALLTPAERDSLREAYWKDSPLPAHYDDPVVQAALGKRAPCYAQALFLGRLKVGDRDTFANLSPLSNYLFLFWMRRRAEGNADLARRGLQMVQAALAR
jgi:hypothetical protein